MSLRDAIKDRLNEQRLFVLPPSLAGERVERTMLVNAEVYQAVSGPWASSGAYRMGRLRADLDTFTEGKMISIANDPLEKPKSAYMARTDPARDEVWDIRSRDPRPGLRVLGCFGETDTFIALAWSDRESLGAYGSREWAAFIRRCKAEWRKLFPTYPPHSGSKISDYVSKNFITV